MSVPAIFRWRNIKQALMANWQSAGGVAQGLLVSATSSSLVLLGWIANLVLIPVVTFYLLRDWDVMLANVRGTLPRAWEPTVVALARECDEVVSAFLRGQLLVMLALGVCYTVGLMLVGLDLALLIGMLAGLAAIVPYLGLLLGISAASVAALLQFGDWLPLLWVALVFTLAQLLEGMYLTPKLVGDRIGLHPVVVIFAVMAGGQLFGFTGVLLALPVSAVIMVLLRHAHDRYRSSSLYGPAAAGARGSRNRRPACPPAAATDARPAGASGPARGRGFIRQFPGLRFQPAVRGASARPARAAALDLAAAWRKRQWSQSPARGQLSVSRASGRGHGLFSLGGAARLSARGTVCGPGDARAGMPR